jgi:AraC family transcriptional activator of pobA
MDHASPRSDAPSDERNDGLTPVWAQRLAPGDPRCASSSGARLAVHDHMALGLLTGGSAVMQQRQRFRLGVGDVFLVPAGERHGLVEARSPEAWGIGFSPACYAPGELGPLLAPFERAAVGGAVVVPIPAERQQHLEHLCAELHRETSRETARQPRSPRPPRSPHPPHSPHPFRSSHPSLGPPHGPSRATAHAELAQKSLLALILTEVARAGALSSASGGGPTLVSDALRFIERRCLSPISLRDVAEAVRRSPSHVATTVKAATGKTVSEWIIAGRMAEARRRLVHTDERVDVLAERVGYADPTHFIRLFRRAHGETPAVYRARARPS